MTIQRYKSLHRERARTSPASQEAALIVHDLQTKQTRKSNGNTDGSGWCVWWRLAGLKPGVVAPPLPGKTAPPLQSKSDSKEQLSAIHPEQDQPEHQQHGDALDHRGQGVAEEFEGVGAQVGSE